MLNLLFGTKKFQVTPSFFYKVITPFSPMGGEGFTEISGMSMSVQTETVSGGGMQANQYLLPKSVSFENLKLKRPMVSSSALGTWCRATIHSGFSRVVPVPMVVMLLNPDTSKPVAIWSFMKVYPVKYNTGPFSAERSEIAYEEMEFAYSSFNRQM